MADPAGIFTKTGPFLYGRLFHHDPAVGRICWRFDLPILRVISSVPLFHELHATEPFLGK
jgi:hypothetical protein